MPNQRARTKIYIGGFVEREFKDKLWQIAREAGVERNQFGFALGAIEQLLKKRKGSYANKFSTANCCTSVRLAPAGDHAVQSVGSIAPRC